MRKMNVWEKIDISSDLDACWEVKKPGPLGYASQYRRGKRVSIHRYVFEIVNGYTPDNVRHTCDNRACANPWHLLAGTSHDNHMDMVERNRHTAGVKSAQAKLSEEEVLRIRSTSGKTHRQIADEYGISRQHVTDLLAGKYWKCLGDLDGI